MAVSVANARRRRNAQPGGETVWSRPVSVPPPSPAARPSSLRPSHRRPATPPRRPWRWLLLGALLLGAVPFARWLQTTDPHAATLRFVVPGQPNVPPLQLEFFTGRFGPSLPSPPPPLGERTLAAGEEAAIGLEFGRDVGRVRYRAEGFGIGYATFALGQKSRPIVLRPGRSLRGRVGEPLAVWAQGWRCLGMRPVAGAEVVLLGGGEHGVELASTRSDERGEFVVEGIDGELDGLALRVRAAGYVVAHEKLPRLSSPDFVEPVVPVRRGSSIKGRLVVPAGVTTNGWRVLARGYPGVEAEVRSDLTFVLDHLPEPGSVPLVVFGLDAALAQLPVVARPDWSGQVEIVPAAVVRGRVVELLSKKPIAGALVYWGDGDAVPTDDDGHFTLPHALPGAGELHAQFDFSDAGRRRHRWAGSVRLTLRFGERHDDVTIAVTEQR